MYSVDDLDTVRKLDLPDMNSGAPLPKITANEDGISVSYLLAPKDWNAPTRRRLEVTFRGAPQCVYFAGPKR